MKKRILSFLLWAALVPAVKAQDFAADSVNKKKFTGIYNTGEVGNVFLVPYFSTAKTGTANFVIKEVDAENVTERNTTTLELPISYSLKTISTNGTGFLAVFIDEARKEEVFLTIAQGNILAKKSAKISGKVFKALSVMGEGYLLAAVEKNGDYTIEELNNDLVSKWKKTFAAPKGVTYTIWNIDIKEGNVEIIRKESSNDGKYLFVIQRLLQQDGEEQSLVKIKTDSIFSYPSTITVKQGMLVSGGFYYKNGIYNAMPDGVYAAIQQSNDGAIVTTVHAPYSQVIEDVKESLGNKLNDPNTTIVFKTITAENPDQSIFMTGQVISRKLTDKGATVTMSDFVTVRFDNESKYLGAVITKNKGRTINLTGDLTRVSMTDLGVWIEQSGLLQLGAYAFLPGAYPIVAYTDRSESGHGALCYTNLYKAHPEKTSLCMNVTNEKINDSATYVFPGLNIPVNANVEYGIINHTHDLSRYFAYFFNNQAFMISSKRSPDLEFIKMPLMVSPGEMQKKQEETSMQK